MIGPAGGDGDWLNLPLELVNLVIVHRKRQCVQKQTAHEDRVNQRKRSVFHNPKCILHPLHRINKIKARRGESTGVEKERQW